MIYIFCACLLALGLLIRTMPDTKNGLLHSFAIGAVFWLAVISAVIVVGGAL